MQALLPASCEGQAAFIEHKINPNGNNLKDTAII